MAAHITCFWPAIHDRLTGGNIYNRWMVQSLQRHLSVEVRVNEREDFFAPPAVAADKCLGLVDSLLLRTDYSFSTWAKRCQLDGLILMVHYLHMVDPTQEHSRWAAKERETLEAFDGFITTSDYVRRKLVDAGVAAHTVKVVRPGLDQRFRTSRIKAKTASPPRVLTVASLLPGKGLLAGLETMTALQKKAWQWAIVGDDTLDVEFASRFCQKVNRSPVNAQVDVVGTVPPEKIIGRYDQADIFLMPSRFETCSMVTMEAMARGLPVVTFDVGGVPELVSHEKTGFCVKAQDLDALQQQLDRLLKHKQLRLRLGAAAAKASEDFSSWSAAGQRLGRLLTRWAERVST